MRFRLVEDKEFSKDNQNKLLHKNDKPVASCEGCPKCKCADLSEKNKGVQKKINI